MGGDRDRGGVRVRLAGWLAAWHAGWRCTAHRSRGPAAGVGVRLAAFVWD